MNGAAAPLPGATARTGDRHGQVCANVTGMSCQPLPHQGDQALFWNASNWQALCKRCHDAKTAREDGGFGNRPGKIRDSTESSLKQISVGIRPDKHDKVLLAWFRELIDQQEVATHMALAVSDPVTHQRVIHPFRAKWPIIDNEPHHDFFESIEIVTTGMSESFPVLEKGLRVIRSPWKTGSLISASFVQGHPSTRLPYQSAYDGIEQSRWPRSWQRVFGY